MSPHFRLLAFAIVLLGAGVAGGTPSPTAESTADATTATHTTVDVDALLAEIDDSDGDGVPDDHDLAPHHPGIRDRSDLDPRGGAPGIAAALVALLGAGALALRRSPPPQL